jgi:NDP-sugar pyrophosphorylase family protein
MRALILAAGEGQRLRPFTQTMPKPMLSIAGRPILEHNVRLLERHGVREIAINLHHQPQAIRAHFGDGSSFGVHLRYTHEPELLGTAGALTQLRDYFTETFLVLYGDNLSTCDIGALLAQHRSHAAETTIALFSREDVSASGVAILDEADRIIGFIEKPAPGQTASTWVNAGIVAFEPHVLGYISRTPCDFGRDVFPRMLAEKCALSGYRMRESESLWWVDSPADYERTQKACAALPLGANTT